MRAPKHIRLERQARLDTAKADYLTNGADRSCSMVISPLASRSYTNLGYRLSPNPKTGYAYHTKYVSMGDSSRSGLTSKQLQAKYQPKDKELYTERLEVKGSKDNDCMIRVGTTPARKMLLPDPDTGKLRLCRIKEHPKFRIVGLSSTTPKDGGK